MFGQRPSGVSTYVVFLVVATVLLGGVLYLFATSPSSPVFKAQVTTESDDDAMVQSDAMIQKTEEATMTDATDESSMSEGESKGESMETDASSSTPPEAMISFSGERLAGTTSPLLAFTKSDYDKALASNKLVVLYFYANWCPTCRAEFPKAEAAFRELTGTGVVGFRVNFNDNETDSDETSLAREFGVAYQHTKVFVKNRERVLKSPETWETDRYLQEIARYQ